MRAVVVKLIFNAKITQTKRRRGTTNGSRVQRMFIAYIVTMMTHGVDRNVHVIITYTGVYTDLWMPRPYVYLYTE